MGAIKKENIYLRLQLKPQFVPILCPCIYLYKKKILFKKKKKKNSFLRTCLCSMHLSLWREVPSPDCQGPQLVKIALGWTLESTIVHKYLFYTLLH